MKFWFLFFSLGFFLKTFSQQNVLVLGDSHGASENGWVEHLQIIRPLDSFYNLSISGNTIGFDNLNRDTLNTLKNIDSYIRRTKLNVDRIDIVLILLGTNDCKYQYRDSLMKVVNNFDCLMDRLLGSFSKNEHPEIIYITPPPFASNEKLGAKYSGGNQRLKWILPKFKQLLDCKKIKHIDLFDFVGDRADSLTVDGVHYTTDGYTIIAKYIHDNY